MPNFNFRKRNRLFNRSMGNHFKAVVLETFKKTNSEDDFLFLKQKQRKKLIAYKNSNTMNSVCKGPQSEQYFFFQFEINDLKFIFSVANK